MPAIRNSRNSSLRWAVRDARYKLLHSKSGERKADPQPFLVDLQEDPGESTDVSEKRPEVLERLMGIHRQAMARDRRQK